MLRNLIAEYSDETCQTLIFSSVTSTNEVVRQLYDNRRLLVISQTQTSGVGKDGRKWDSPLGNLYASLVLVECDKLEHPTMLAALAICRASTRAEALPIRRRPNSNGLAGHVAARIGGFLIQESFLAS